MEEIRTKTCFFSQFTKSSVSNRLSLVNQTSRKLDCKAAKRRTKLHRQKSGQRTRRTTKFCHDNHSISFFTLSCGAFHAFPHSILPSVITPVDLVQGQPFQRARQCLGKHTRRRERHDDGQSQSPMDVCNTTQKCGKINSHFWHVCRTALMDETRKRKVECTKEEEEAKREEKRRLDREKKRERRLECPALPSCAMCGAVGVDLHRLSSFPPNLVSQLAAASGCILPPSGHVCGAHFTSSLPQSVRTEGERDVAIKTEFATPFWTSPPSRKPPAVRIPPAPSQPKLHPPKPPLLPSPQLLDLIGEKNDLLRQVVALKAQVLVCFLLTFSSLLSILM